MPDRPNYSGAPRWAKVLGMIVISIVVLLVLMRITGHTPPHGGH